MYLITNIKGLVQVREQIREPLRGHEMSVLPVLENAWLLTEANRIAAYGPMSTCPKGISEQRTTDASGRFVFPSFVDAHTHIVFAGSRETEFTDRILGLSYEEMARKGGGILNSARLLQQTSEDDLYKQSMPRVREVIAAGTGSIEIKSGYGLTLPDELKILRVAKRIAQSTNLFVRTTFLGAHAIPSEYTNREDYINLVCDEMIPAVAAEKLADYCDVFCDRGFFTPEETDLILKAGLKHGLQPKVHANELALSGGVQVAVSNRARSADHLEHMGEEEINLLQNSRTIPVLLPGTAFFLKIGYPDARRMIAAHLPVALSSDYNPGTCPSGNMSMVLSLACTQLRMTPEEAINAATINSAFAMDAIEHTGSVTVGKRANLFITKPMPSYAYLPYSFGSN
ncbi:MAG: imidazolonepropionase, partial [Bacteroidota bacterium]